MATGCSVDAEAQGLVGGHAYGLIDAAVVTDRHGNEVQLLKLRNPWGSFEWNGDWSDSSNCWTDELKRQVGLVDADDGTFWMSFDDFKQYFSRVQICKVNDNHTFNNFRVNLAQPPAAYHLIKMKIEDDGEQTFSVSQKGARMFPRNTEYEYSSCRVMIIRSSNGEDLNDGVEFIGGTRGYE